MARWQRLFGTYSWGSRAVPGMIRQGRGESGESGLGVPLVPGIIRRGRGSVEGGTGCVYGGWCGHRLCIALQG